MKNKKYTQKRINIRNRRRGIHLNNNILNYQKKKEIKKGWEIGIIAKRNKKLTQEQINTIKQDLNNPKYFKFKLTKIFNIKIKLIPNKVFTNKGILIRMGKGKGKIKTKGLFLIKNMVCIELKLKEIKNNINFTPSYINLLFSKFLKKYTFFTIRTSLIN